MKPHIEIIRQCGHKFYMYDKDDGGWCDFIIVSDDLEPLRVEITDGNSNTKVFHFDIDETAKILSFCISKDTVEFIKILQDYSCVSEKIEEMEVHFRENFSIIDNFKHSSENKMFKSNSYFLRLTEAKNDQWSLSFVFCSGEIVSSQPTEWNNFSAVWQERV